MGKLCNCAAACIDIGKPIFYAEEIEQNTCDWCSLNLCSALCHCLTCIKVGCGEPIQNPFSPGEPCFSREGGMFYHLCAFLVYAILFVLTFPIYVVMVIVGFMCCHIGGLNKLFGFYNKFRNYNSAERPDIEAGPDMADYQSSPLVEHRDNRYLWPTKEEQERERRLVRSVQTDDQTPSVVVTGPWSTTTTIMWPTKEQERRLVRSVQADTDADATDDQTPAAVVTGPWSTTTTIMWPMVHSVKADIDADTTHDQTSSTATVPGQYCTTATGMSPTEEQREQRIIRSVQADIDADLIDDQTSSTAILPGQYSTTATIMWPTEEQEKRIVRSVQADTDADTTDDQTSTGVTVPGQFITRATGMWTTDDQTSTRAIVPDISDDQTSSTAIVPGQCNTTATGMWTTEEQEK